MIETREFRVTLRIMREHFVSIVVRAGDQDEADDIAFDAYWQDEGGSSGLLGLSDRWHEQDPHDHDPEIDPSHRCVDCGEEKVGDYYMVSDEFWAATGLGPNDGMLCLLHLERRLGRHLTLADFTAITPSQEAWQRHLAECRERVQAAINGGGGTRL